METIFNSLYSSNFVLKKNHTNKGVKKHLKMEKGCKIDTGLCKKISSKKDPPKTLGTSVSGKTGTGLGGQRARQA